MTKTVFFPIFKVSTKYVVRRGRIWTPLEHMLLKRLDRSPLGSLDLARLANLPVNLIIQALIELLEARWIQIISTNAGVLFEATESGRTVSTADDLPQDWTTHRRGTMLCMDRVVSSFFKPDDLTLIHRDNLPPNAIVVKPREHRLSLSPASSLDRLYMLEDETFEEWVDYRVTSQNLLAVASVSESGKVEGVPDYAPPALTEAIIAEIDAAGNSSSVSRQSPVADTVGPVDRQCYAEVTPDDFVIGGPSHLRVIETVFREAKSFVVVHSCFVGPNAVNKLLPHMKKAATRGVGIELLWGQINDRVEEWSKKAFDQAKAIFESLPEPYRSKIRFAKNETASHCKILIADCGPDAAVEAWIGSCNWLSAGYDAVEVSVRIKEQWLVGYLAALLASLRQPSSGPWSADVHRLVEIYNRLRRNNIRRTSGPHKLDIVLDREHLALVREARDCASTRVTSGCDLYGPAGETSVFVPMRASAKDGVAVDLWYHKQTTTLSDAHREEATAELEKNGIHLTEYAGLHGKFLAWDSDTAVVTSFNWLATTPDPWKPIGAEVGIVIRGSGIVAIMMRRLESEMGPLKLDISKAK
jgi:hypothetical protein